MDLVFVFDGEGRPKEKRGHSVASALEIEFLKEQLKLFKELLLALAIPWHDARAEAEAECGEMAMMGIVDAVWSEDSDTLMFGCPVLFRNKLDDKGQKSKTHVQTYRIDKIRERHEVDRTGFVMFALLVGCDYDMGGLQGCGPQQALPLAKGVFAPVMFWTQGASIRTFLLAT